MREKNARDRRIDRPEDEYVELVPRDVDAHRAGRLLPVVEGAKSPARARADEVDEGEEAEGEDDPGDREVRHARGPAPGDDESREDREGRDVGEAVSAAEGLRPAAIFSMTRPKPSVAIAR